MIHCSCWALFPWSLCRHKLFESDSGWKRARSVFWKIICRSKVLGRSTSVRRCSQRGRFLSWLLQFYVWILIFFHVGPRVSVVEGFGKDGRLVLFFGHFIKSCTLELLVYIFLLQKLIPRSFKRGHLACRLVAVIVRGLFGTPKPVLRWGLSWIHQL